MKNIKGWVNIWPWLVLLFAMALPAFAQEPNPGENNGTTVYLPLVPNTRNFVELSGVTYLEMPEQRFGGPVTAATVRTDSFNLQEAYLELSGEVRYANTTYPLRLTGLFYASSLGQPGDKVGELVDTTGNFVILHAALRHNPTPEFFSSNGVASAATEQNVLFLYLLRNGSREVTVIEAAVNQPDLDNLATQLLQVDLKPAALGGDYWQYRLFTAVADATTVEESDQVMAAAVQDSDVRVYAERYNVTPSCWVTYNIRFQAYSSGPSDIGRGAAEFNHELNLLRKWTDSNCALYRKEDSPYRLGAIGNPVNFKTKAYGNGSSVGDVLLRGRYNGVFESTTYPGQVSLEVGITVGVAGVNWSYPLCCTVNVDANSETIYSHPDSSRWTKLTSYIYKDRYLRYVNQRFNAIVQVAWHKGGRAGKPLETIWKVPVYAAYDGSSSLSLKTTISPDTVVSYTSG